MFGQEARLPTDFLLGHVGDLVPGRVQDWLLEHQVRLMLASRRKERHDQQV